MEQTLNTSWILWHHSIENKMWDENSYNRLWTIETVEDYWKMVNSWDKCLPKLSDSMFFVMRKYSDDEIVLPMWEDKYNIKGGYWSFKVSSEKVNDCWNKLLISLLGEKLCNECDKITGISCSPKKNFCIIKVWSSTKDFTIDNLNKINEDLVLSEAIFRENT